MSNYLMDRIPRYESKYFNCVKAQAISYLKYRGFPVEWLLFNSLETTKDIYDQFITNRKMRWQYLTSCMSIPNLNLFHIDLHETFYESFSDAESEINRIIDSSEIVIAACDLFYLPHRGSYYNTEHISHYITIVGKKDVHNQYYILDDDATGVGDYSLFQYDEPLIAEAFIKATKNIIYFNYDVLTHEKARDIANQHYRIWLENYEDDFAFYDSVTDIIQRGDHYFSNANEAYGQLIHSFSILSGSRQMFAQFCRVMDSPSEVVQSWLDCSKQAEVIKNVLIRSNLTKRIDIASLEGKCMKLKEMELNNIELLKKSR